MGKVPDAVILLGHGSRVASANAPLVEAASMVLKRLPGTRVSPAFLQLAEPSLAEAVALLDEGKKIVVAIVPFFLYPGAHVTDDIPAEVERLRALHPAITLRLTGHMGIHPLMADIVVYLINETMAAKEKK